MATLRFVQGQQAGREVALEGADIVLGRSPRSGLRLEDARASAEHAVLRCDGARWWLHDLRSVNGTTVNGAPVSGARLENGDRIAIGDTVFTFHAATDTKARSATAAGSEPPPSSGAAPAPEAGPDDLETVRDLSRAYARLTEQLGRAIVGQREAVEQVLLALFCRGHALLVGVPGVAKTMLVSTLGHVLDLDFRRVQFTPDLMPTDITGCDVLEEDRATGKRSYRFLPGPLFANLVLADEINRAPPKTQAALLEAMQERRVTAGEHTYRLPDPFVVLATQNPIEQEGTYPLPEAELDRFLFQVALDYPGADEESTIIRRASGDFQPRVEVSLSAADVLRLQNLVRRVPVADRVVAYARDLARRSRPADPDAPDFVRESVAWGAGPRAGIALVLAAKARAVLNGRVHATTEDVRALAPPVLRHRIVTTFAALAAGVGGEAIARRLLDVVRPEAESE